MKAILFTLFVVVLSVSTSTADESGDSKLQKICKKISGGVEKVCSETIRYPKIDFKKEKKCMNLPVTCKSKRTITYPCGVKCKRWKCKTKKCTKRVCVPGIGLKRRCIDMPTGVTWEMEEVSICKNFDRDLIKDMSQACNCIDSIVEAIDNAVSAVGQGRLSESVSRLISAVVSLQECIDAFVPRLNNAAAAEAKLKTEDHHLVMLQPIDLIFYEDLLLRFVTCATSGNCQQILQRFLDYLQAQKPLMLDGLKAYGAETGRRLLAPITNAIAVVDVVEEKLTELVVSMPSLLANCTSADATDAGTQLGAFVRSLQPIQQMMGEIKKADTLVDQFKDIYKALSDAVPDSTMDLFKGKNLNELKEIFNKIPEALRKAPTVESIGQSLRALSDAIKNIDDTLAEGANGITIDNIKDYLAGPLGDCVKATGIVQMTEISDILQNAKVVFKEQLKAMIDKLKDVNGLSIRVDTKAYNTWKNDEDSNFFL